VDRSPPQSPPGASVAGTLAERVLAGDRRSVARTISLLEDGDARGRAAIAILWRHTGRARTVGLTGPPGVGKSSLASAIVAELRRRQERVAVVCVDPSSPFTSGALLGDRIRLADHFLDPAVFIRSMSTRGHLGGVAEATFLAAAVLDAAGYGTLLVESVGVGQSEIEIAALVDATVLVLQPGSGDSVQALKAGVMEIPDVICINKADRGDLAGIRAELRQALSLAPPDERPSLVATDALAGDGIEELLAAIEERRSALGPDGLASRRRARLARELRTVALARATRRIDAILESDPRIDQLLDALAAGETDPISVIDEVAGKALGGVGDDEARVG
jgi:LAO/AO transport system kinase